MKCRRCSNDLTAYLEGSLGDEARARVEQHLAGCGECRRFADILRESYSLAAEEYRVEPAPFFYTRVKARLERGAETTSPSAWRAVWQPAFFSLLLLLGIYSGIRMGGALNSDRGENLTVEQVIPWINEMETEPMENFLMN